MGHHTKDIDISEKFEFTGREKSVLGGLMGLGVICLAITYFQGSDDHHLRFWTNFLHNTVFFTGIAFISMFLLAAKVLAYSGWHTVWKRLLEAKAQFLIFGLVSILLIWLGSQLGMHHIYHWNFPNITDEASECFDPIIGSKAGFLNSSFYLGATLVFGGLWYACVIMFRRLSLSEDANGDESYSHHKKMKLVSAFFMPFGGFTSAALIWLWVMSIDSHWYSTMFAWYATASWLVSAVALLILTIIYLKGRGYFSYISGEHIHDLGKYLFGFSIFWTYLWFSQFMLIWYANVGEETIYFDGRMNDYPLLFWANLVMNFALPLLVLVRNDAKRKFGILTFVCVLVLFGHWWDFFQMIKPGALHTEHMWHSYQCAGDHGHADDHSETGFLNEAPNSDATAMLTNFQDDNHAHDDADHAHGDEAHADGEHHHHDEDAANADEHHHHGEEAHEDGHSDDHGADGHHDEHHSDGHHDDHHGDDHAGHHGGEHGDHGGHDGHHHDTEFRMGFTVPGLLELGTFIGFLAFFYFVVFTSLAKAALVPKNDPYLDESLHHHVGYGGGNMEDGGHH